MTDRVLGPGGRGMLVVTSDEGAALAEVQRLRTAGVPSTTPGEAGLWRPTEFGEVPAAVRFWSTAARRAAVGSDGDRRWTAVPGGDAVRAGPGPLLDPAVAAPPPRVTVFGGAWVREDEPEHAEARQFGRLAAGAGFEVANGGYGGIMAAVSRGAAEAGGTVVGVTIG
ncbi:MAG TPA: hypothetical protein VE962_05000, partial [Actinomycetota bacterium]|nr:hypothetical protein [Actinomycetota bacterium]